MAVFTTTRTVPANSNAIGLVIEAARALGYEVTTKGATRAEFKFAKGSAFAWNPANNSHKLAITSTGTALLFEFDLGWNTGGDPQPHLDPRADAIAAAIAAAPQPIVQHVVYVQQAPTAASVVERQVLVQRCGFCKKLTPVDLTACAECGAKL